jgi:hypothetical protein
MSPTTHEFDQLVKTEYASTWNRYQGYFITDRGSRVVRWSRGASEIFGINEHDMLENDESGERKRYFSDFFPSSMGAGFKSEHKSNEAKIWQTLDDCIASGESFGSKSMGSKAGKVRTVEAKNAKGEQIWVQIELCPLFYRPEWYFIGFVNATEASPKTEIRESEEVDSVVSKARDQLTSKTEERVNLIFKWVGRLYLAYNNNSFKNFPPMWREMLSTIFTGATIVTLILFGFSGWYTFESWRNRKPPSIIPIDAPLPTISPSPDRGESR